MMDYFKAWLIGLPFLAAFMFGVIYILHRRGFFEHHSKRVRERIEREKEDDAR